jgi:hypothetical protein
MAITEKPLAQKLYADTNNNALYTVPAGVTAIIKSVVVCNFDSSNQSYKLFIDIDGTGTASENYLFRDVPISAYSTDIINVYWPMAAETRMSAAISEASKVTITVFGAEIT